MAEKVVPMWLSVVEAAVELLWENGVKGDELEASWELLEPYGPEAIEKGKELYKEREAVERQAVKPNVDVEPKAKLESVGPKREWRQLANGGLEYRLEGETIWRRHFKPPPKRAVPQLRVVEQVKPEQEAKKSEPEPEPEPELEPEPEVEWNGILDRDAPLDNARKLVGFKYWHKAEMMPKLNFWQGEFWEWRGKHWKVADENTIRSKVYEFLDGAAVQYKTHRGRFLPTNTDVNKVVDALKAETNLEVEYGMPGWLMGEAPVENLRELVAVQNGLLHVPSRKLLPHTPRFWSPNVLEFEYDPKARAPRFEQFLGEVFPGDSEAQQGLLEMIGLCLTDETKYQKAFMFVGPKRGGRGTIGRLLRGLVGDENYTGPKLRGMSRQFGMQSWIGKKVALFPDVRTDGLGIDRLSTISETLLSVTGEDAFEVERKYLGAWNGKLSAKVVMFSNELIMFQDDSGALPSRFITWQMRQSFWGKGDLKLTDKLLAERSGILNLAFAALDKLRARNHFVQPGSGAEMSEDLEHLASDIACFIADCCVIGPDYEVRTEDAFLHWKDWCQRKGIRYAWEEEQFSQKLRSKVPGIIRARPRRGNPGRRTLLIGIGIRAGY